MSDLDRVPDDVKRGLLEDDDLNDVVRSAHVRSDTVQRYSNGRGDSYLELHVVGVNAHMLHAHMVARKAIREWKAENPKPKDFSGEKFPSKYAKSA